MVVQADETETHVTTTCATATRLHQQTMLTLEYRTAIDKICLLDLEHNKKI